MRKSINIYKNPDYYFNREMSLIEFNSRVLKEAECKEHPLLERLKFIAILSSNLDEFFMIRIAGLKRQIAAGFAEYTLDGMTPSEQLQECVRRLRPLYKEQERAIGAESNITRNLNTEITRATTVENEIKADLQKEIQNRIDLNDSYIKKSDSNQYISGGLSVDTLTATSLTADSADVSGLSVKNNT